MIHLTNLVPPCCRLRFLNDEYLNYFIRKIVFINIHLCAASATNLISIVYTEHNTQPTCNVAHVIFIISRIKIGAGQPHL